MWTSTHQVLAATLTLSQPGGGQIMSLLYWCPHQVLKASGAPDDGDFARLCGLLRIYELTLPLIVGILAVF